MTMTSTRRCLLLLVVFGLTSAAQGADAPWKKHVVQTDVHANAVVAADFTGDGKIDIMSNSDGKTLLYVAPDWKQVVVHTDPKHGFIHGEVLDADGDGDPDFIGAQYSPGLIVWLERPSDPLNEQWPAHLVDNQVDGIHGVITGDVNRDGKLDLLANSAQPTGLFHDSLVWYDVPKSARTAKSWDRHVFADKDAPGLSHYLGFGDVNGDGLPDAASAAKGDPAPAGTGDWFAWWQAPADPRKVWTKHLIADKQPGATNIHPADVNGDGKTDFIASRGHGVGVLWFEAPDWKAHDIDPKLAGPHCLVAIDMDGDGDIDAATCAKDSRVAAWFENDGKGKFTTHVVGRDQSAYDIRAVDLDGDKDLDLLIAGHDSKNVVWYENPAKRASRD